PSTSNAAAAFCPSRSPPLGADRSAMHPPCAKDVARISSGGGHGEILPQRQQGREERHGSAQEGHAQKWQRRQGRHREEPQAGDSHRPVGSAQEGQEGACQAQEPFQGEEPMSRYSTIIPASRTISA